MTDLLGGEPRLAAWVVRIAGSLLFVSTVVLVAVVLARAYRALLDRYAARPHVLGGAELAREFNPLFARAGSLFIGLIAFITVLHHFGVNVASLVVSLGVGSLAIGLAAQDTLANMFAGFTLMLDRPFRPGDRIQLASGEVGDVEAIGIRATLIKTAEETILVVPNSLLVKERLVNLSRPTRHLTARVEVGVAYGSDLARVKDVLRDAALASPHVDRDRAPVVQLARFGDFAVHFVVVFWARDYLHQGPARSDVAEAVYRGLTAAGIEIPQHARVTAAARRRGKGGLGDGHGSRVRDAQEVGLRSPGQDHPRGAALARLRERGRRPPGQVLRGRARRTPGRGGAARRGGDRPPRARQSRDRELSRGAGSMTFSGAERFHSAEPRSTRGERV